MRKKWFIILIIALVLLYGIFILLLSPSSPKYPSTQTATITPAAQSAGFNRKITYDTSDIEKMLRIVKNRSDIGTTDQVIRKRLIASLNNTSGILEDNDQFRIEYIKTPDIFLVGIKSLPVSNAKKETASWFIARGLSDTGMCKLPVIFYLLPSAVKSVQDTLSFTHLPEGC